MSWPDIFWEKKKEKKKKITSPSIYYSLVLQNLWHCKCSLPKITSRVGPRGEEAPALQVQADLHHSSMKVSV